MKSFLFISLLTFSSVFARDINSSSYESIQGLYSAIKLLAKLDLSCEEKSDCKAIALGKRACGGPNGYTFTSINNPNFKEIEYLAQSLAKKEAAYNDENGVISICLMATVPVLDCQQNRCTKVGLSEE